MPGKPVQNVEAVDRALQLLTALAEAGPGGASLAQLAASVDSNKSTAYRALTTLRLRGFATQNVGNGFYEIGPAALELGDRTYAPHNLAQTLHPALVALSRATDELVHLGVLAGDHVLYVDKVEPARAIRVWSAIGQCVPVASTSMGRALLAARNTTNAQLAGYLSNLPTDRQVTPERLLESVTLARGYGYAVERGENEPDVACIGTAIMRGATAVAALSITGLETRITPQREQELVALIVAEAGPLLPSGLSLPRALTDSYADPGADGSPR